MIYFIRNDMGVDKVPLSQIVTLSMDLYNQIHSDSTIYNKSLILGLAR